MARIGTPIGRRPRGDDACLSSANRRRQGRASTIHGVERLHMRRCDQRERKLALWRLSDFGAVSESGPFACRHWRAKSCQWRHPGRRSAGHRGWIEERPRSARPRRRWGPRPSRLSRRRCRVAPRRGWLAPAGCRSVLPQSLAALRRAPRSRRQSRLVPMRCRSARPRCRLAPRQSWLGSQRRRAAPRRGWLAPLGYRSVLPLSRLTQRRPRLSRRQSWLMPMRCRSA